MWSVPVLGDAQAVRPKPAAGRVSFMMGYHLAGGFAGYGGSTASPRSLLVRLIDQSAKPIFKKWKTMLS